MIYQLKRDWWLVLLLLVGCTTLGIIQPKTFNEKMVAAVSATDGVVVEATKLVTLRVISPDDGQNIQDQTTLTRAALVIARDVNKTDPAGGQARLEAALVGINGLKAYLCLKPDAAGSPLCLEKP